MMMIDTWILSIVLVWMVSIDPQKLFTSLTWWLVQPVFESPTKTIPGFSISRQLMMREMSVSGSPPSFSWNLWYSSLYFFTMSAIAEGELWLIALYIGTPSQLKLPPRRVLTDKPLTFPSMSQHAISRAVFTYGWPLIYHELVYCF